MRDTIGKKINIAVFKNIEYGNEMVDGENFEKYSTGYVRISDWMEVEFAPLKDELVIDKYIEALDRSETKVRLEFQKKLDEIATQRSNLLALAHKPAA